MYQDAMVKNWIDAGASFLGEFEKTIPLSAAFWLQSDEGDFLYLHVVSEKLNDENSGAIYRQVNRVARQLRDSRFDPFRVKLIKPSEPAAIAARVPPNLARRASEDNHESVGDRRLNELSRRRGHLKPTTSSRGGIAR